MSQFDERFWELAQQLVEDHRLVIDRPRESVHPRYPGHVYPLDYGYLEGTRTTDGGGIDVWRGSVSEKGVTGLILTIDVHKRDAELKLLVGCTSEEAEIALSTHRAGSQAALLITRHGAE